MLSVLNDYLSAFADKVTHYQKPDARRVSRWDGKGLPAPYRSLADIGENKGFYHHMLHAPKPSNDPALWRIMAFGFDKRDGTRRLSGLKVHFPPSYVFSDPSGFVALLREWCGRLDAVHGSGGLGVLTVPGEESSWRPVHYPFMLRYPALEYDAMGAYWSEVRFSGYEKPRSSNWLTILGQHNVNAIGGAPKIQEKLLPEMELYPYENGIIIRTGHLPELGDGPTNSMPEAYRAAARIIKPIRFEGYEWSVMKVPAHTNGLEATLNWIRRFD